MPVRAPWWRLPFLYLPLLALPAGCKPRPLVCEAEKYFQVPETTAGAAHLPDSRDRFGPEVSARGLLKFPLFMAFSDDTRARVDWMSFDLVTVTEVVYSPGEALVRPVQSPGNAFPLRRFTEGQTERAWLGFRSRVCTAAEPRAGLALCREFGNQQAFFVADMACKR